MLSKDIVLNYGEQILTNFIPQKTIDEKKFLPLILPKKLPVIKNVKAALENALEKPVGIQKPLSKIIKENYRGGDVSIITDDHDRPNIHTRLLLPILIDLLLTTYHLPLTKIKVVIATGTHRPSSDEELKKIFGEQMFGKVNYVIHKCKENNVEAGEVNGQKIKIDSEVFNSDIIIPLTDVENHYFAGVAGGPKSFCRRFGIFGRRRTFCQSQAGSRGTEKCLDGSHRKTARYSYRRCECVGRQSLSDG